MILLFSFQFLPFEMRIYSPSLSYYCFFLEDDLFSSFLGLQMEKHSVPRWTMPDMHGSDDEICNFLSWLHLDQILAWELMQVWVKT
jgi:hypothetical protein